MGSLLRHVTIVAAFAAALVVGGCLGGNGSDDEGASTPAESPAKRTNSAKTFSGERRAVAAVVERFEAAIRRGDRERLCKQVLAVAGSEFGLREGGAVRDCLRDPEFAPKLELREAAVEPGGYDLVVPRVKIEPREDRFKPDAIARVEMPDDAPNPVERFELQRVDDEWMVYARFAPVAGDEPDARKLDCEDGSKGTISSTDLISIEPHKRPTSAEKVLLRKWEQLFRSDSPGARRAPAVAALINPGSLVRVAVVYGYAGATYELRSDEGARLALFDLERFDRHYFNWRTLICARMIRQQAEPADEGR